MLDNEALQALAAPTHPKNHWMIRVLEVHQARKGRLLVPAAVRVEAGIDRRNPTTARLAWHGLLGVALDSGRADRAAALRHAGGSTVDVCVAEVAASVPEGDVTVITSDLTDIPLLLAAAGASRVQVRRI